MSGDRAKEREVEAHAPTAIETSPGAVATPEVKRASLPPVLATRYELKRVIGVGGMGLVYEALDLNLHRLVALKVLKLAPTKAEERADAVNRLVREARAMAALSHKNVVTVHDVGYHEDQVFVAMQLVDGTTMRQWLQKEKRSTQEILHVLYEAGSGLAAAHAARLIHRDFKPDNILVSQRRTVRVTDFGLARRSDGLIEPQGIAVDRVSAPGAHIRDGDNVDVTSVTRSGAIVGTPAYMAPEQAQGAPCDARADQFSFCVTAWEALFGGRPFAGKNWSEIYTAVQKQEIALPPIDRSAPRTIQKALRRGLAVDPAERFPSMVELLEVFEAALRAPMRRRTIAFGVLAIAAVVVAVIVTRNVGSEPEQRTVVETRTAPAETPTSTMSVPDRSTRNMQLALKPKGSGAATPPAPEPERSKPRDVAKPDVAKPTAKVEPVPTPPPAPPAVDPRLETLRASFAGLDAEYQRRELLATDLPASYQSAKQAMHAALDAKDAERATAELAKAREAIASVTIDRDFVNAKVQRIQTRVPAARKDELTARFKEVIDLFAAEDYAAANRKINAIARDLK